MVNPPAFSSYGRLDKYTTTNKDVLMARLVDSGHRGITTLNVKEDLVARCQRLDRGLMVYDTCSNDELWGFVTARNINRGTEKWPMNLLMAADETPHFRYFSSLPPELRARIYDLYIQEFPVVLKCPVQPTIARASRLLRKEALPLFYQQRTFTVNFLLGDNGSNTVLRSTPGTVKFFRSIPEDMIVSLRRLKLELHNHQSKETWLHKPQRSCEIDLHDSRADIARGVLYDGVSKPWRAVMEKLEVPLWRARELQGKRRVTLEHSGVLSQPFSITLMK